jgi:hypothetical protein
MSIIKSTFVQQLLGFIAGINKHYGGATLQLDGKSVTSASLVTLFQACVDAEAVVKQADAQRTAAVATATAAMQQASPSAKAFKAMVLAASGDDTVTLADFALKPRRVGVVSSEVKADAAKKGAATRKALGTKGSKQKKEAKKALAAAAQPVPGAQGATATPAPAPVAATPVAATPVAATPVAAPATEVATQKQ